MAMVSNVEAVTVVTAGAAIMEEEAEEACPMVSVATPVEEAVATNTTAVETTATVGETTEPCAEVRPEGAAEVDAEASTATVTVATWASSSSRSKRLPSLSIDQ